MHGTTAWKVKGFQSGCYGQQQTCCAFARERQNTPCYFLPDTACDHNLDHDVQVDNRFMFDVARLNIPSSCTWATGVTNFADLLVSNINSHLAEKRLDPLKDDDCIVFWKLSSGHEVKGLRPEQKQTAEEQLYQCLWPDLRKPSRTYYSHQLQSWDRDSKPPPAVFFHEAAIIVCTCRPKAGGC